MRLGKRTTVTLVALRAAMLALMVILLLRPVVVVSSVIPRSSYVAMLVDDSVSMKLRDVAGGATRLDSVKQALLNTTPGKNSFLNRLEQKFKTNLYGFSRRPRKTERRQRSVRRRTNERSSRAHWMKRSNVLQACRSRLSCLPLTARQTCRAISAAVLRELRARDIAVFTVGVGNTARPMDAELTRVNMPRKVLVGSRLNIETIVGLSGYGAIESVAERA